MVILVLAVCISVQFRQHRHQRLSACVDNGQWYLCTSNFFGTYCISITYVGPIGVMC